MTTRVVINPAAFWEFKARCAAFDLELVRLRTLLATATAQRNALVDAFTTAHGLAIGRPLTLEDTDCSVSQADPAAET